MPILEEIEYAQEAAEVPHDLAIGRSTSHPFKAPLSTRLKQIGLKAQAGELVKWVKYSLHAPDDLSLDPPAHIKLDMELPACNSSHSMVRWVAETRRIPESLWTS